MNRAKGTRKTSAISRPQLRSQNIGQNSALNCASVTGCAWNCAVCWYRANICAQAAAFSGGMKPVTGCQV